MIALMELAASATTVGSEVDVSSKIGAIFHIHFGRTTASAPTVGVTFRVEVAAVGTGVMSANASSQWYTVASYTSSIIAAFAQTPSATATNALTVGAVTNFAAQDVCVVSSAHASPTLSNTEWCRLKAAASTTMTAEENFKNAYTAGSIWNKAEVATIPIDLTGIGRVRVVVDGSAHNQTALLEVYMSTFDQIGAT